MTQELTPKAIGDYVHQATEVEKQIYTLQEAEKAFRQEAVNLKNSQRTVSEPHIMQQVDVSSISKENSQKIGCGGKVAIFFAVWIISGILGNIIVTIITGESNAEAIVPIFLVLSFFITIIVSKIYNRKAKKQSKLDYDKEVQAIRNKNSRIATENAQARERYLSDLADAKEEYRRNCRKADILIKQADELNLKIVEMKKLRTKFYSVDVIPPDYRTIDCVFVLDHIFRNRLADNMREAILQYEDRVFKGEVLRGMEQILRSLSSMGAMMSYLANTIENVQRDVSFMSQDIMRIADAQVERNKSVNAILDESKATRYAVESIQKCTEYNTKQLYGYIPQ